MKVDEKDFRLRFLKNLFYRLLEAYVEEQLSDTNLLTNVHPSIVKDRVTWKKQLKEVSENLAYLFLEEFEQFSLEEIMSDKYMYEVMEWILEKLEELGGEREGESS